MPKIESEKIDCYIDRARDRRESVRTHSEVIEQLDSFSLLKLLFLVRNWHCCSRKAFPRQRTPRSREKTAKTAFFRHRWQAWKVVRSIGAVRQRPRTPRNWRCSFAFFESLGRFCIPFDGIFWTECWDLGASSENWFRNGRSNGRSKRNLSEIPSIIFGKVTAWYSGR